MNSALPARPITSAVKELITASCVPGGGGLENWGLSPYLRPRAGHVLRADPKQRRYGTQSRILEDRWY